MRQASYFQTPFLLNRALCRKLSYARESPGRLQVELGIEGGGDSRAGFHPRTGQSGKALLADPNQDRRKKVSKSSLGEEVSDDDVLSEECFKRSCQGYLFLAQYISLSFFLSDSSLACFDERSPRNTDVFRFSCFLIFNIFFYSSLCVSLSIFFLKK